MKEERAGKWKEGASRLLQVCSLSYTWEASWEVSPAKAAEPCLQEDSGGTRKCLRMVLGVVTTQVSLPRHMRKCAQVPGAIETSGGID